MIMPFLRLVIIYVVVILAAVLFFNRDRMMAMMGYGGGEEQHQQETMETAMSDEGEGKTALAMPIANDVETTEISNETEDQTDASVADQTPSVYPTAETAALVAPKVTTIAPTTPSDLSAEQVMAKRMEEARTAYWSGDMVAAAKHYAALVKDLPNNPDMHGEYGNLLYAQQRYSEAAEQYFAAGKQLISEGKMNQAMPLVGVLQNLAPEKAAELRKLAGQ